MRVEVALPVPVSGTFTYETDETIAEGTRVRVPFSGRRLIGWVVGPERAGRTGRVLRIDRVLETDPGISADLLDLCRWIADYYLVPLGVVLRAALPAALSRPGRVPAPRTRRMIRITRELPSLAQRDELFARAPRQRAAWDVLESAGGRAAVEHMSGPLGFSSGVLRGLVTKGLAVFEDEIDPRDPFADQPVDAGAPVTPAPLQRIAIEHILAAAESAPRPALLFGITGSGKTLVYIEVLDEVVRRRGRGAIVLVPEIALTPQTVARFRARFGNTIAVLHSGLSEGERHDAWRALRSGERRIAIGARSAVFAPVRDLGVIVVDEEHEATYKQSEAPRYHAREVAIMRAHRAGALCVLGSATPALESWHNAMRGKYTLVELGQRVGGGALPPVRIIDLRRERERTRSAVILSGPLVDAIGKRLERREQCILLLNRRGFSSFVQCRACGYVRRCHRCNVSLTYHRARRRLVCHYCFHEEVPPVSCEECGSGDLSFRGVGTEQVEREVAERFPAARVARMDVDTTSGKWAHHEILGRVGAREVDILLGTQMIAKGLDFPDVTLVGVVDADVAMNLPDFRASERTFQLLTQVAGRAGRGPAGGEVIVQSALPDHYAIRCASTHDFRTFAEREIAERAAHGYPPHTRLVNVLVTGSVRDVVERAIHDVAERTAAVIQRDAAGDVEIVGPAPCPIDRLRGRWRWHFLLRATRAAALDAVCRPLLDPPPAGAGTKLLLDRDPVTLL